MAKIRKIYDEAIKPDGSKQVVYPITSTRAVYTTTNVNMDTLLNEGYRFGGVVLPTDSPVIIDQRVFYGASVPGVYTNFGGISVDGGEAIFLMYDGTSWYKGIFGGAGVNNLSGFKALASISDLPLEKTTLGYLIKDETVPAGLANEFLYVWVGEHGDTLDGLYQNCGQLRGASAYEVAVRNGYEGTEEEWLNDPVNGIKGNGIKSFEVVGEYSSEDSAENTYRITPYIGEAFDIKVKNGKGIAAVQQTTTSTESDGVNVITVAYSDGTSTTFQVKNGAKGNSGVVLEGVTEESFVADMLYNGLNADDPDADAEKALTAYQGYVLDGKITELGQEVYEVQKPLKNNLECFEGQSFSFAKISQEDLTSAGNLYINGYGEILPFDNSLLYYYAVEKGKIYKVSSEVEWESTYYAVAFSKNVPAENVVCDELLIPARTPGEMFYIAPDNGYICLVSRDNKYSSIFVVEDLKSDLLQEEIDGLAEKIVELNVQLNVFEVVTNPTFLGNGYMARASDSPKQGGVLNSFDNSSLYYYPVEKGKIYKVSSEIDGWGTYASVGFSKNFPAIGNTYDEWIIKTAAPDEKYYIPGKDGYILLAYRNSWKSYIYLPTTVPVSQILNEINELKGEIFSYPPLKKDIICSGSSITWGNGHLDSSMVEFVDKFIKEHLSKTILCDNQSVQYSSTPTNISNWLLYGGTGKMISGVGESVEFDLFGNEIAICQLKRRVSSAYGLMKVYADGTQIGIFDNKNAIETAEETFTGDAIREIKLAHPCTFNHQIYINGSSNPLTDVVINTNSSSMPETNCNAWVFRGSNEDGSTCHYIQFAESLGTITSVRVVYDYGRIIAHERSTIGQTDNEYTNEYVYGKGDVSYDPDQPTTGVGSGLEFKAIDRRAFFIYKFSEYKTRHFKVEIIGGTNPYFVFNFATNRYHNLMNAGIGGWELRDLLRRNDKVCHYTQFFKYWHPNILFEEAMTNDDWSYPQRRISRSIGEVTLSELQKMHQLEVHKITYNSTTEKYAVEMCTGIISSITETSLISSDIIGTDTQVGDIIRIGTYRSDMRQIVCRRLTDVNTTTGEVKWLEPLRPEDMLMVEELSDLVGAEINIRNLDGYKSLYIELIERVHAISPETKIVIVHNGLPNLWTRQLWGYEIVHAELCQEYENVAFINAQEHIYDVMFNTISGSRKETVTNTGASSYDLSFAGTQYGGWQGFKVLVNGVDVYGKDAYIEMDMAYRLNTNVSGSDANKVSPYDRTKSGWNRTGAALKLYFTQNVPAIEDTIEVQYADNIWSADFCHPTADGAMVYGESYCDIIERL